MVREVVRWLTVALVSLLAVFLWWSDVLLRASCMAAWGFGLFCGVGGPRFDRGCLGLVL